MKYLIILFVTILSQNNNVKCNFLDSMGKKILTVASAISHIVSKMQNMFDHKVTVVKSNIEQYVLEDRLKQSFNDFVEKTAAYTESPEFCKLRSEPTALMSTSQLAALHGKRVESHIIKTKDDYLLTLHRIQKLTKNTVTDKTVLLHHGLMGSSADWILLGPNKSLPYLLSDAGYDVWMTNARGNYYSRGHISQRVNSSSYWKFSFQEMGEYDLPAAIDSILKIKGKTYIGKIDYIGHSMGATALLVLLSTNTLYNQILRMGVLLAPLAYMSNAKGPMQVLTTMSQSPPKHLLKIIGDTEFLPSRKIPKVMISKFCNASKLFCSNPLLFLAGSILQNNTQDAGFLARLLYHAPAGLSTNTILHYAQLVQSKKFHRFGQPLIEFPLTHVVLPIVMMTSSDDWLSTVPDVMRLYFNIANPIDHYVIRNKNISHTEFVWGTNANLVVFKKVMEFLTLNKYMFNEDNEIK